MNIADIAARNRANRIAQLERLRPVYHNAKQAEQVIRQAREGAKDVRAGLELMTKLKHVPGFFPTPPAIVQQMIEASGICPGDAILEPSAGKGNIALAVREWGKREAAIGGDMVSVRCIEKVFQLAEHLRKIGFDDTMCADFLECWRDPRTREQFDRVLMNPPFEHRQDVKHVQHAHQFLKPGGRLVAIVSSTSGAILEPWACDRGGYVEPLEAGAFKTSERPTGVSCSLVVAEG